MGARTLEATLRTRLLAVLVPVFVGVALASVVLTSRALDALDTDAARARADAALKMMRAEQLEGDAPDLQLREVLLAADADGVRIVLRLSDPPLERTGSGPVPRGIAALRDTQCVTAEDEHGVPWRGCAVKSAGLEAIVSVPIDAHRHAVRALGLSIMGMAAIALLGAIAAARVAVRRPLASVSELAKWSERVVAGDARPPPPPTADAVEVELLAATFDDVVRRLFDALDRERANSAHIAHELRTPLTGIRAELETLEGDAEPAATRMLADVTRLSNVVDAILILSSPPRAPAKGTIVNVADLARAVSAAETKVVAPDEALIEGDARLIEIALQNLLENAVKYSGRAAEVVSVSKAEGGGLRVAVSDAGPGLSAEAQSKMFDRYWRSAPHGGGAGLGLALVRAVAERHGGRAEARDNPRGRGLEVSMVFPLLLEWHDGAEA